MSVLHNGKVLFSGTHSEFSETYKGEDLEQSYMNCLSQMSTAAIL